MRYLNTIYLPADETCLHLFEAASEADVHAVVRRAGIDADRIVLAEQTGPDATSSVAANRKDDP